MEDSTQAQTFDLDSAQATPRPPFVVHLAPPFNGWTGIRSPTPRGFWSAVRTNGVSGEIVMQLGRRFHGPAPYTRGRLVVGWRRNVWTPAGAKFRAIFAAGPITLRPNGGWVNATVALELRQGRRVYAATARPVSHRPTRLEVEAPSAGDYELRAVGILDSFYWGHANPYGEIIGRFADVQRVLHRPIVDEEVERLEPVAFQAASLGKGEDPAAADEQAFAASEQLLEREESEDPGELAKTGEIVFEG